MKKTVFLITGVELLLFFLVSCTNGESKAYLKAMDEMTIESFNTYLTTYPYGAHKEEVFFYKTILEGSLDLQVQYLNSYKYAPRERFDSVRNALIKQIATCSYDTAYAVYSNINDFSIKKEIDSLLWRFEEYAFNSAIKENDISQYNKYIEMHPKGIHIKQIHEKMDVLINEENSDLMDIAIEAYLENGGVVKVWEPDFFDQTSPTSYIKIENDDTSSCNVYLRNASGKVQIISLAPHATIEKTITNGTYDLVIYNIGVIPYACRLNAKGSHYGIRAFSEVSVKNRRRFSESMRRYNNL